MATFIMTGRYSGESVKQISSERTARAGRIVEQCGGKITGAWATLGATDVLLIAEFPGVGEAMKASVGLNEALGIAFSTVPALRVEEFDKLLGKKS